jgi:two-component system sensor histidine kinase MprB
MMSLRTRITLAVTVVLAVVAIASSFVIWGTLRSQLRGTVEDQLRQIVSGQNGGRRDQLAPRPEFGPGERFGGARGVRQLVRPDGSTARDITDVGSESIPVDDDDVQLAKVGHGQRLSDVHADGTHLLVLTIGIGEYGAVQVARPLDEVDSVLDRAAVALVLITLLGIVMAAALGRLVARVALRPVARFTDEAEEIASASDTRRRLDVDTNDEVGRLADSFNSTLDSLEQSLDSQRRLIADAGHELRTPIASIRANIQLLDDADRLPDEDVVAIRADIVTELDELTELLADVIELARGSDPGAPMDEVNLDEVVRESAQRAARRGDSDVSVELDLEPTVVMGDAPRIARAVTNVVDNARKWSPAGGTIHIRMQDGVIVVRDEGPGVPEADIEHVWDRFHRADAARSMPGSGLGLSIVRQTVAAHGGTASIANGDDGTGAIVTLDFGSPVAVDDPSPVV